MASAPETDQSERADALGGARPVERGSFRDRVRRKPGMRYVWRGGVFLLGLLFIAGGVALIVLPGPLTIPPVIIGLWIWSTEFEWAHRFFAVWKEKGQDAWAHAKRRPVSSTIVTVGGLALAGFAFWAARHWHLVARAEDLVGLS